MVSRIARQTSDSCRSKFKWLQSKGPLSRLCLLFA